MILVTFRKYRCIAYDGAGGGWEGTLGWYFQVVLSRRFMTNLPPHPMMTVNIHGCHNKYIIVIYNIKYQLLS